QSLANRCQLNVLTFAWQLAAAEASARRGIRGGGDAAQTTVKPAFCGQVFAKNPHFPAGILALNFNRRDIFRASGVGMGGAAVNDDLELINETLSGNSSAFGQLVTRYQDRLYNTLVHVMGSADDARDVCQDALVQAFVKLNTFQRSSAFYTW